MNKQQVTTLSGYSIIHGIIDLSCVSVVLGSLTYYGFEARELFILIVTYNIIAFGLQAPFGYFVDRFQLPKVSALIGCILVLSSIFLFEIPALAVILSGLGNAFFHVGGGSISLNINPQKATAPGIFVAPGALGLTVGTLIGKSGTFTAWPFILLLLFACVFILLNKVPKINYHKESVKQEIRYFKLVVILILLSVSIRALYGLTATWKVDINLLLTLTIAIFAGKALGGIVADKFGWIKTAIFALLISAPLLSFFQNSPVLAIAGVFLFQMTMPITVTALSNMLPGRSATAFGLTVLALIIGVLPTYFGARDFISKDWITFVIIIISTSALLISFKFLYTFFKSKLKINL